MEKNASSKNPLKPKTPFMWVFMDIIPATEPKSLSSETTFSNYLLIVDTYSKFPKRYGMYRITTKEVMNRLDMFHSRSEKIDEFVWWNL